MILLLGDTGGGRGHLMGGARRVRGGAGLKAARLSLGMLPGRELTSTRLPHTRLSGDSLESSCWQPGDPRAQADRSPAAREAGAGREICPATPAFTRDLLGVCVLVFRASPMKGQEAGAFAPDPPHSMSTRRC